MLAKKSIFEMFRLVDKIDEENEISNELKETETHDNKHGSNTMENSEKNVNLDNESERNNIIIMGQGQSETYSKPLTIDKIYEKSSMEGNNTKTIFIIDQFFKALPTNIPMEIRKQSILNIIRASNMNLRSLLKDGEERLNALSKFLIDFCGTNDENIINYQMQIEELNKEIEDLKKLIHNKQSLQEEQKSIVEFEMQRINDIINAVK